MMPSITNYLTGSVKIRITGANPEKFINLCMANHINLWQIYKTDNGFYAFLRLDDFFSVRSFAKVSRTRIKVVYAYGLPFIIKKTKRRKMLLVGAVCFFVLLNILSSYIWFVDFSGIKYVANERIKEVVYQAGLRPGVSKDSIDTKKIEKAILLAVPEIAWVGVRCSGTRAEIEIVEKTFPNLEDKSPADVVAMKDGLISEMIVLAGQPVVKKGNTVKKGDVLIKGTAYPESASKIDGSSAFGQSDQLIRARGIIKAHVWYESYGESELVQTIYNRTGRRKLAVVLVLADKKFTLKGIGDPPFEQYEAETIHKKLPDWRNSSLFVESTINIYHELNSYQISQSADMAVDRAKLEALNSIQLLLPETAEIIARKSEIINTAEQNIVRVKVSIETIEDIGQTQNIFS